MRTRLFTKKELRQLLEVSPYTLNKYLNIKYFNELSKMGYDKRQKIFTAEQYLFLREKLVIIE